MTFESAARAQVFGMDGEAYVEEVSNGYSATGTP